MVGGLGRLFTRLKSAFAPSIWGVLSTIIGMAIFTGYQAKFCAKLDNKLTILTLDVWVANLNQSSIIKSETSMKNLEATIKNADAINDGASLLLDNLTLSNSTLQEFSKTSELLNNASERFALGSDKILSFQEGLQTLYGQMKENNDRMSNYISTSVNATSEFQNNSFNNLAEQTKQMGITFQQQNEQIRTLFENLKMYEENYLERQSQYIKNLTELTEASKIALDSIKRSKDDVVAAVGDPLRNELMMKLAEINSNLGKVGNPLSETAEIMQNMLENVIRNFEEKTNQITAQNVNTNLVQKLDQLIDIIAQKDGNNAEDKLPVINELQAEKFPNPKPVDIDNSVITSRLDRLIEVLEKQKQTSDNNSLVVDRLNQLINISENQQTISVETPKSEKVWLRFVPAAIAILMFVSLLVQVHINSRIGTLQESQQTKVVQSMPINKN